MALSPRFLSALSTVIAIGILAVATIAGLQDRQATWDRAVRSLGSLRTTVSNDIARTIEQYDLSLRGAVEALAIPGIDELAPDIRKNLLFDRSAGAEYLGAIVIMDADGRIVEDSASITPRQGNYSDRDYFRVQKDDTSTGLYLSAPFEGRISKNRGIIALSRRISDKNGDFAGIVAGFLRSEYFENRFQSLGLESSGVALLARNDGIVLMREPNMANYAGRDLSRTELFQTIKKQGVGTTVGTSALDGTRRLYSFERVGTLPLIVSIGLSVDSIMAPWREKALIFAPLTLLMCGALVGLSILLQRELKRRNATELVLAALAGTDALTGLPNRRTFDQAIEMEWRSCRRAGVPLSLLFIDVDFFKSFNDRYGHDVGDQVLRILGATIDANIRRPRDRAARYGGEEFTVILPETAEEGALQVAAKIKVSVSALRVPDAEASPGSVTVSIGLASMVPGPADETSQLIAAADAALYRAKTAGRNRIETCQPQPAPSTTSPPKMQDATST